MFNLPTIHSMGELPTNDVCYRGIIIAPLCAPTLNKDNKVANKKCRIQITDPDVDMFSVTKSIAGLQKNHNAFQSGLVLFQK